MRVKKPLHEDEQSYGHPIYGFGSRAARDGFRVLWLSGAYSADALLTKQRELGRGKHTIAFLDHAMTESERRRLARKIKEDGLSSIFMVIDRVLYMYLIHNYSESNGPHAYGDGYAIQFLPAIYQRLGDSYAAGDVHRKKS